MRLYVFAVRASRIGFCRSLTTQLVVLTALFSDTYKRLRKYSFHTTLTSFRINTYAKPRCNSFRFHTYGKEGEGAGRCSTYTRYGRNCGCIIFSSVRLISSLSSIDSSFVGVHLPVKVPSCGLMNDGRNAGEISGHVMFETVFTDVAQ